MFLRKGRKGKEPGRGKEYYQGLVQKAVTKSQAIKNRMDLEADTARAHLTSLAKRGRSDLLTKEGNYYQRQFERRIRALDRIRRIQADAFELAFGRKPPGFGYLPKSRKDSGVVTGREIP